MAGYNETLNNLSNYRKIMSGQYTNYGINANNINMVGDTTISAADNIKNASYYAQQATNEESHQSDLKWYERFRNTMWNTYEDLQEGVLNFVDGIGDFAMSVVGTVAGWFGNDDLKNTMQTAITTDWQAPVINFDYGLHHFVDNGLRTAFDKDYTLEDWKNSFFSNPTDARATINERKYGGVITNEKAQGIVSQVVQGVGQALPSIATGQAIGAVGKAMGAVSKANNINLAVQAINGFTQGVGNSSEKTINEGRDLDETWAYNTLYGVVNAALNTANAKLGGSLTASDGIIGKGIAKVGQHIAGDGLRAVVTTGLNLAADVGIDVAFDTLQEAIDPILRRTYDASAIYEAYGTKENVEKTMKQIGEAAIMSAISSTIANGIRDVGQGIDQYKTDKANIKAQAEVGEITTEIESKTRRIREAMDTEDVETAQAEIAKAENDIETALDIVNSLKDNPNSNYVRNIVNESRKVIDNATKTIESATATINNTYQKAVKAEQSMVEAKPILSNDATEISMTIANDKTLMKLEDFVNPEAKRNKSIIEGEISAHYEKGGDQFYVISKGDTGDSVQWSLALIEGENAKDVANNVIVSLDSRDLNISDTGKRIEFSSKNNDGMDIVDLRNTLDDGTNTYDEYVSDDGKERAFRYDNGTAFTVDEDGNAKMITDSDFDWDKYHKATFGERQANARTELIREASPEKYVNKSDVNRFTDTIKESFFGTAKDANARAFLNSKAIGEATDKLYSAYNLDSNSADPTSEAKIDQAVSDYLMTFLKESRTELMPENAITEGKDSMRGKPTDNSMSLWDSFESDEARQGWLDSTKQALRDYLDANAHISKLGKERAQNKAEIEGLKDYYETKIGKIVSEDSIAYKSMKQKLQSKFREAVERRDLAMSAYNQSKAIKNKAKRSKEHPTAAAADINPTYASEYYQMADALSVSKSAKGYTVDTLEKLIDINWSESLTTDPVFAALYNRLKSSVGTREYTDELTGDTISESTYFRKDKFGREVDTKVLSNDDTRALYEFVRYVDQRNTAKARKERIQFKKDMIAVKAEMKYMAQQWKNKNGNKLVEYMNSTRGPESFMNQYFGRGTTAYNMVYRDVVRDHRNLALYVDEATNYRNQQMKNFSITENDLGKKMTLTGGLTLNKSEAMELYAAAMSDNLNDLLEHGFQGYNTKSKRYTDVIKVDADMLDELTTKLSDNEKGLAMEILTNGYNGMARKSLSEYGKQKGIIITEESGDRYMHINRGNLRIGEGGDMEDFKKFSSMGYNMIRRRTNNSQPMMLRGLIEDFDQYMYSVGQITKMDEVRKMNRMLDMKNINWDDGESRASTIAENIPNGAQWINNWIQRANLMRTGTSLGNSRLLANSMVAPIALNIGTWAKLPLDALRLIPDVGLTTFIKGVTKGIAASFTPQGRATYSSLVNNSGYYVGANAEHFRVAANTLSNNFGKITEFMMKPIEAVSNYTTKYIVTGAIEEYIAKNNASDPDFAVGGSKNIAATQDWLDTMAQVYLSSSDRLDVSALREGSGPGKALAQIFFAPFGGDAQKWSERMYEAIMGGRNARMRAEALENGQAFLDRDISTFQDNIERYTASRNQLQSDMDALDPNAEGYAKRVRAIQRRMDAIDNRLYEFREYVDGLNKAKVEFASDAASQRNVQANAPRKAAMIVGTLVASAMIESLIDYGNGYLKGKDEDKKGLLEDFAMNATIGWMPYISTFANAIKYNSDISANQMSWLSSLRKSISSASNYLKGDHSDASGRTVLYNMANTLGYVVGIPFQSISDYTIGTMKNIDLSNGASAYALVHGYNSSYLNAQIKKAKGNADKVRENVEASMNLFKTGKPTSQVSNEIARLYNADYNVIPRDYATEGYDNAQQTRFRDIYSVSNIAVNNAVATSGYMLMDDKTKAKTIKAIYNAYYDGSKAIVDNAYDNLSRSARIVAYTSGNVDLGTALAVAYSASDKNDIMHSRSLSSSMKLLACYLGGYTLSETELARLRRFLKAYSNGTTIDL